MEIKNHPSTKDVLENWTREEKISYFETKLAHTERTGIGKVLEFCRSTDFYTAPSSANHHSNYTGGLLDHSLLVYSIAMGQRDIYIDMKPGLDEQIPEDSVAISALLHDICKVGFYTETQKWKKDASNNWVSYPGYEINDRFPIGHGEKSVIMLQKIGLELTPEEMLAIRYHMGVWMDLAGELKIAYGRAQDMCPLMTLLQTSDISSSLLFENKRSY